MGIFGKGPIVTNSVENEWDPDVAEKIAGPNKPNKQSPTEPPEISNATKGESADIEGVIEDVTNKDWSRRDFLKFLVVPGVAAVTAGAGGYILGREEKNITQNEILERTEWEVEVSPGFTVQIRRMQRLEKNTGLSVPGAEGLAGVLNSMRTLRHGKQQPMLIEKFRIIPGEAQNMFALEPIKHIMWADPNLTDPTLERKIDPRYHFNPVQDVLGKTKWFVPLDDTSSGLERLQKMISGDMYEEPIIDEGLVAGIRSLLEHAPNAEGNLHVFLPLGVHTSKPESLAGGMFS